MDKDTCIKMGATCTCFNLRRAARMVTQAFDEYLRPSGLKTTQLSLLVAAFLQPDLPLGKLARMMGSDRTTLSRNLKLLEKKGMVNLEKGEDQRQVRVSLTPQGLEAMERAVPLWQEAQDRIEDGVGLEKWGSMLGDLRMLGKVVRGL